jgi:hypothetical protein
MALLRWIYLRKLTPIEDLIVGAPAAGGAPPRLQPKMAGSAASSVAPVSVKASASVPAAAPRAAATAAAAPSTAASPAAPLKDALLGEIRQSKKVFYNMVVAQAQKIDVAGDRVTFLFSQGQRALRDQLEQQRPWLESVAQKIAGRPIAVSGILTDSGSPSPPSSQPGVEQKADADRKSALREQALADTNVQAMLEIFPAEIRDVEEM